MVKVKKMTRNGKEPEISSDSQLHQNHQHDHHENQNQPQPKSNLLLPQTSWVEPQQTQSKSKLKAGLLLLTLISFYYHGFSLIISSSFLNPGSIVHGYKYSHADGDGMIVQSHHHPHNLRYADHHHPQEEYASDLNHDDHNHEHGLSERPGMINEPQANDILTKLKHPQGRIHEDHEYGEIGGAEKLVGGDADDDKYGVPNANPLIRESVKSKPAVGIGKRYALSIGKDGAGRSGHNNDDEGGLGLGLGQRGGSNGGGMEAENFLDSSNLNQNQKSSSSSAKSTAITCKDESGNGVSWYIAYKLPQITSSADPLIQQGSKYYYLLPGGSSWTPSQYGIHEGKSILGKTMGIMWEANSTSRDNIAQVLYNDQPPSKPAVVMNGHTKGLILTTSAGGLWLQHSCPHFPDPSATDFSASYPPGGLINGQMFFCMTLENITTVDMIGSVLQYTKPFLYNHSIPEGFHQLLPQLTKVAEENATVRSAPWFSTYEMLTAGSSPDQQLQLKVFAKGPKFRKEIYSAWIALDFGVSLDVQSWLNGAHPYMSNCTSNVCPVYNIMMKNMSGQNFSYTDDHSKWAVSVKEDVPLTCVGDLNRMKPQRTRGGVAICMRNKEIWSAFKALVEQTQPCNSTSLKKFTLHKRKATYPKDSC